MNRPAEQKLTALAMATCAAASSGDLEHVGATLAALAHHPSDEAQAWHATLSARASMLRPKTFPAPTHETLQTFLVRSPRARRIAALALIELERRSAIAFDARDLRRWLDLNARLLTGTKAQADGELELWLELGHLWLALLDGDRTGLDARAAALEKQALAARLAPLVVDASALRSLAAGMAGHQAASVELARRASRMARTEALPQQEFLAHLVLARARRLDRNPHLAIRILSALRQLVSPPFLPWVTWELLLAGDLDESRVVLASHGDAACPAWHAARALLCLQDDATAGTQDGFDRACEKLRRFTQQAAFVRHEALILIAALDPQADTADAALQAWRCGQSTLPPAEIHGLCVRARGDDDASDDSEAYVLAMPDRAPQRLLGMGANLVKHSGLIRLRRTRRQQGRVETMAAVLALAGERGLEIPWAFAAAYEFPYEPEVHRSVLDVLLHRLRTYLQDAATCERVEGTLRLRPRAGVLIPDPRCAAQAYDRLLRILARGGRTGAREAASKVGLSVRAVQVALKSLAETGACLAEKQGQQLVYLLEDTTFSESTRRLSFASERGRGGSP